MLGLLEPGESIVPRREGRRGASFLLGLLLLDMMVMVMVKTKEMNGCDWPSEVFFTDNKERWGALRHWSRLL